MKHPWMSAAILAVASIAHGQQPIKELYPTPATFPAGEITLNDVLAILARQTGNVVADRRTAADNVKMTLPMRTSEFWPTMDAIGAQTGIGFSPYGGVSLMDAPYRKLRTSYSGLFRFSIKRVQVGRDDETQMQFAAVTLDVAWEPRFEPFYLNLDGAVAKFAPDAKGNSLSEIIPRHARGNSVAGSTATEVELRMKAPDRTSPALASLTGTFEVIGPPKMVDFAFPKLAPIKQGESPRTLKDDGVQVSLTYADLKPTRWSIDVEMVYSPRSMVSFESFQADSWRANNRVWLTWGKHKLEPSSQSTETSKLGTKLRYNFLPKGDTPLPAKGTDITLTYRTPNRVVAFAVPFAFRDLPLP